MKKIMFNDKYGLTAAVLNGEKTMTRRIIKAPRRTIEGKEVCGFAINKTSEGVPYEVWLTGPDEESLCQLLPTYKVGEVVAVAQSYKDIGLAPGMFNELAGWNNKMFADTYWIKRYGHQIRITDIKVERLQDISNEDCLKEGVTKGRFKDFPMEMYYPYEQCKDSEVSYTSRYAFKFLIDKVSGKGTWDSNPWVFAYTFKLERSAR